jgi:carbonic anhydrase
MKKFWNIPLVLFPLLVGSGVFAESTPTPDQVITRLKQGNDRYLTGLSKHTRIDIERRVETAKYGQKPLTTILGCSDARVPPEIVFDQGFAEVFVVRVAGNVCGEDQIASVEYGTQCLGAPVVVVLGHSKCGAVDAAIEGKQLPGSLPTLVGKIHPAVEKVKQVQSELKGEKLLDECIKQNVWNTMEDLFRHSPIIVERVKKNELKVVGAVRDIKTGKVEWLGEHPAQQQFISEAVR